MIVHGEQKKYGRLEFEFNSSVDFIKVLRPDGKCDVAHSFTYQPIEVSYNTEGLESVRKTKSTSCRCRYTPDFIGKCIIEAYLNDNITDTAELEISDSTSHGYVEISNNDKKYFSYSDGTPFFSIGINIAFPTACPISNGAEFGLDNNYAFVGLRQYERWLKKLSENGCNVARVWLGHEYFTPDTQNIYEFDYAQFTKIDMLLELAKKYGIKLKFTLDQFRFFDYERVANSNSYDDDVFRKFNKRLYNGENRCENINEWLTDDVWVDAWLAKAEEFAKRYSGDTEIFAIELWNEMNCLGNGMKEWNEKVLPKVKAMFPKNFVINSLGSLDSEPNRKIYLDFCWDKSDFVQIHRYLDQGAEYDDCKSSPIEMIQGAFDKINSDRAVFIAETGAVNNCHSGPFKFYVNDHDGIIFADTVYTPVFCKSCGTGNIWHWDERYVEFKNLYHMFKPISELMTGIEFDKEEFEPTDMSSDNVSLLLLKGKTVTLGYIRNKEYNWKNVLRDLKDVSPVDEFRLELDNVRDIKCFPVWASDETKAEFDENSVRFANIGIGTLFSVECRV